MCWTESRLSSRNGWTGLTWSPSYSVCKGPLLDFCPLLLSPSGSGAEETEHICNRSIRDLVQCTQKANWNAAIMNIKKQQFLEYSTSKSGTQIITNIYKHTKTGPFKRSHSLKTQSKSITVLEPYGIDTWCRSFFESKPYFCPLDCQNHSRCYRVRVTGLWTL